MLNYQRVPNYNSTTIPLQRDQTCFRWLPVNFVRLKHGYLTSAQAAVQAHAGLRHIPQQRRARKTAVLKQFEMKRLAQTGEMWGTNQLLLGFIWFQPQHYTRPGKRTNITNWKDPPCYLWVNPRTKWPCSSSQTVRNYQRVDGSPFRMCLKTTLLNKIYPLVN